MRLLWVSHLVPYPPKSGVHLRSFHLLREVASRHDVDLVAFIQESWLNVFFPSPREGLAECERVLERLCRSVRLLDIDRQTRAGGKWRTALESLLLPLPYTVGWLQSAASRRAFRDLAARRPYALVHFDTLALAPFRQFFSDTPATLGHHNIESQLLLRRASHECNPLKRLYFYQEGRRVQRYERQCAAHFAAHITCSELDSARLQAIAPSAHTVAIPNGVDLDYFRANRSRINQRSVIFVGSLNWYPNVDAVLFLLREIWPLLKSRATDVRLHVVGSAPPRAVLEAAAALADVTVHGFVDDVRPLLDTAAVYVCPIRDGGGTKLKLLDAFAMEQCVVAHPVACEGLTVVPGVHVELADSPQAFAKVILGLLGDPAKRQRMGSAARTLVEEHYSYTALGPRLCEVFESVAAGSGRLPEAGRRSASPLASN